MQIPIPGGGLVSLGNVGVSRWPTHLKVEWAANRTLNGPLPFSSVATQEVSRSQGPGSW